MKPKRPHLGKDEIRYHGTNSCWAIWQARPKDIIRIHIHRSKESEYKDLIKWAIQCRKNYTLVDDRDLEKLTDTTHHQGICIIAKERKIIGERDFLKELRNKREIVLYLDGIGNPHNLGAILRTAAHFGVPYVCVPQNALPRISPAAHRTSEGAAEFVTVVHIREPSYFLNDMKKKGFQVYGMDITDSSQSLYGTRLSEKSLFVLGSEVQGISPAVLEELDNSIKIPGTGVMESLNVSVAAALAMGEFMRQGAEKTVRIVKGSPKG